MGRARQLRSKMDVEGFSEAAAEGDRAPLGIKVTIIEPGGFRTDFAGSSTTIQDGRPEYDSTIGAAAGFQRDYNGAEPGDPSPSSSRDHPAGGAG